MQSTLDRLSPEAAVVAQLIALMGTPYVTQTALRKGLRWLNLKWQRKRYVRTDDLRELIKELEAAGLQERLRKPHLSSEACKEILAAVVAGDRKDSWYGRPCKPIAATLHDSVCEHVQKVKAGCEGKHYWQATRTDYDMFLLQARMIYLIEGPGERFEQAVKDAEDESFHGNWAFAADEFLYAIHADTALLPASITAESVLREAKAAIDDLEPLAEHIAAIRIELGKGPEADMAGELRRAQAQAHLLRGEFEEAVTADSSIQTRACVALLKGQHNAALKKLKTISAGDLLDRPVADYLNLLTASAFLLGSAKKDWRTAMNMARQLGGTEIGDNAPSEIYVFAGSRLQPEQGLSEFRSPVFVSDSRLTALFKLLCRVWRREKIPDYARADLQEIEAAARQNGNIWYSDELAGMLGETGKGRLAGLGDFAPEWMQKLAALRAITVPKPTSKRKKSKKAASSRLIWVVEDKWGLDLVPYEQMLQKNGTFSKGRKVALKRLHGKPDFKGAISEEDEKLLALIECETSWGRYGAEESYYLNSPWVAVIGHPLVFHPLHRDAPIPVVRGTLSLSVSNEQGGHRISVNAPGGGRTREDGFLLDLELDKLTVTPLSEQQETCLKLLKKDLFVPEEGQNELRSTLDSLAAVIPIQSELRHKAATAPADAGIVFRLEPQENLRRAPELIAKAVVYPLGPDGPHCEVGVGAEQILGNRGGVAVCATRDLKLEEQNLAAVLAKCPTLKPREAAPGLYCLTSPQCALEGLAELKAAEVPLEWPKGEPLNLRQLRADAFKISVKEVQDWFEFSGKLAVDEKYVVAFQDLLDSAKIFGRFIRLDDGSFLQLM